MLCVQLKLHQFVFGERISVLRFFEEEEGGKRNSSPVCIYKDGYLHIYIVATVN